MTFSSEDGSSRGGGSILVVGGASSEFVPAVQALQSMADTTLVPPAEALAALSRLDANVLVVPARFVSEQEGVEILKTWLDTPFEGGRHARRVEKIEVKEDHDE